MEQNNNSRIQSKHMQSCTELPLSLKHIIESKFCLFLMSDELLKESVQECVHGMKYCKKTVFSKKAQYLNNCVHNIIGRFPQFATVKMNFSPVHSQKHSSHNEDLQTSSGDMKIDHSVTDFISYLNETEKRLIEQLMTHIPFVNVSDFTGFGILITTDKNMGILVKSSQVHHSQVHADIDRTSIFKKKNCSNYKIEYDHRVKSNSAGNDGELIIGAVLPIINSINTTEIPNKMCIHQQIFAQRNEDVNSPILSSKYINSRQILYLSIHKTISRTTPAIINNTRIFSERLTQTIAMPFAYYSASTSNLSTAELIATTILQFINNLYASDIYAEYSQQTNNSDVSKQPSHEDGANILVFFEPQTVEIKYSKTANVAVFVYNNTKLADIFTLFLNSFAKFTSAGLRLIKSSHNKYWLDRGETCYRNLIGTFVNLRQFQSVSDELCFKFNINVQERSGNDNEHKNDDYNIDEPAMTVTKAHDKVPDEDDINDISARIDIDINIGIGTELGQLQRKPSIFLQETKDEMKFEMRNLKGGTKSGNITGKDGIVPQSNVASSSHRKNENSTNETPQTVEKYSTYQPQHHTKDRYNSTNTSKIDLDTILPERTRLRRQRRLHANESLEETKEDPIERLNRLKARISGALHEVKGVLKQYSTDTETETEHANAPTDSICMGKTEIRPKADELSSVQFRFVRKVRRRSIFNEEESNLEKPEHEKSFTQQEQIKGKCTENTYEEVPINHRNKQNEESTVDPQRNSHIPARLQDTAEPPVALNIFTVDESKTDESVRVPISKLINVEPLKKHQQQIKVNESTAADIYDLEPANTAAECNSKQKTQIRNKLINGTETKRRASIGAFEFSKNAAGTVDKNEKPKRRSSDSVAFLKSNYEPKITFAATTDHYVLWKKGQLNKCKEPSSVQKKSYANRYKTKNDDTKIIDVPQYSEGAKDDVAKSNKTTTKESKTQPLGPTIACKTDGVLPKSIEMNDVGGATKDTHTKTSLVATLSNKTIAIEKNQTADAQSINDKKTKAKSSIWPMPNTMIPALPSSGASSLDFTNQQQRLQQHSQNRSEAHADNVINLLNENYIDDTDFSVRHNQQIVTDSANRDIFHERPQLKLEILTKTDQSKFETESFLNSVTGEPTTALQISIEPYIDQHTTCNDHKKSTNQKNRVSDESNQQSQTEQVTSAHIVDASNNKVASKEEFVNNLTVNRVPDHCCSPINDLPNISATGTEIFEKKIESSANIQNDPSGCNSVADSDQSFGISKENMPDLLQTSSSPVQAPTIQETAKGQHHVNKRKFVIKKVVRKNSTEKVSNTKDAEQRNTKINLPDLLFSKGTVNKIRQNEIVVDKDLTQQHETGAVPKAKNEEIEQEIEQKSEETIMPVVEGLSELDEETTGSKPIEVVNKERKIKKKVIIKRQKRKLSITDYTFFKENDDIASNADDANNVSEVETLEKAIAYVTDDEADSYDNSNATKNMVVELKDPVKSCLRSREYQIGDLVMYAERYKKTQVRWKKGVVLERITSISYKLDIDGKEIPAHISYIKKYTDRKVNFGFKEYLEIDYEQVAEEEKRARSYSIWNMV